MSGDIYFSLGEILTLNVKNGENLKKQLTVKKYSWSCNKFTLLGQI